ncbi:Uncharacterised protein [Klebsiella pneumoniae]|uniref:Uncharacterized protein n=1 Tax=Klebsiella pneumoniae TaxID=573 RepID=A0A2X3ECY9_KLEPN|nr:Uncharacterised protein [Klebsiella pneumoniae]
MPGCWVKTVAHPRLLEKQGFVRTQVLEKPII